MTNFEDEPHGKRSKTHPFGWLKYGNPPCDLRSLPKCQATAKSTGTRCGNIAVKGKRVCRMHGGISTGPQTKEGLARSRMANWKHGLYSAEARDFRKAINSLARDSRTLLKKI